MIVMNNLKEYYKVLGLVPGASLEEINQAYKDLALVWHPDRMPKDNPRLIEKSVEKIKTINHARDQLRKFHRQNRHISTPPKPSPGYKRSGQTEYRRQSPPPKPPRTTRSYYQSYRRPSPPPKNPSYTNNTYRQSQPKEYSTQPPQSPVNQTNSSATPSASSPIPRPFDRDLHGVDLQRADLKEKDFSGRNLKQANLSHADLSDSFLHKVVLEEANLTGANLFRANLLQANLRHAILKEANLIGADLSGADLSGADLTGAKVGVGNKVMVKLTGVKLTGTILPDGSRHS